MKKNDRERQQWSPSEIGEESVSLQSMACDCFMELIRYLLGTSHSDPLNSSRPITFLGQFQFVPTNRLYFQGNPRARERLNSLNVNFSVVNAETVHLQFLDAKTNRVERWPGDNKLMARFKENSVHPLSAAFPCKPVDIFNLVAINFLCLYACLCNAPSTH